MKKKLPIGIQNFKEIIETNCVYVDKTGFVKQLIDHGKHFFLSRPRRFGKSLFLKTLEEVFKGKRDLFKGLEIDRSDYQWEEHPVIHFDFSKIPHQTTEKLEAGLKEAIESIALKEKISTSGQSFQTMFERLIQKLAEKNRVVILVDEYDKPIINNLKNQEIAEGSRDLLRDVFTLFKSLDQYIHFTFITGVSKFSQVSLFSGPNNLTDITMDPRYACMMGYTDEEIKDYFKLHIRGIVDERKNTDKNLNASDIYEEIRQWYNGYRFTAKNLKVYNPYSTLLYLDNHIAESYWYQSGTPLFLLNEVRKRPQSLLSMRGKEAIKSTLSDISDISRINLAALMFQAGYLTIIDYHQEDKAYKLDFPNNEVKEAFFNSLIQDVAELEPLDISRAAVALRKSLETLDLDAFIKGLNTHLAKIPYHAFQHAKEGFFHAVIFSLLEASGIKTLSEVATNIGRIDLITETDTTVCIFELKFNQSAEIALTQAEVKKYKERFSDSGKQALLVGVNFSSKTRTISDWSAKLFASSGDFVKDISP